MAGKIEQAELALTETVAQTDQALASLDRVVEGEENAGGLPEGLGKYITKIPSEWCAVLLTEISNPKQWKTISTKNLKDNGYVVYGANGKIGFYDEFTHEFPTVMITCRGATCGNIHVSEPESYINGNAMALDDLSDSMVLEFLRYGLLARKVEDTISGSAQPQITRQGLSSVKLPLPPLAEQTVIAQTLDTLLAQVDNIKTRLDAIPNILKTFRQSVLAAAVSGKLTEKWRGENEVYLTKEIISTAHRSGWEIEKYKEFELKDKFPKNDNWKEKLPSPYQARDEERALYGEIPKGWELVSLDQVTRFVKDGPHFSPKYSEEGVPFISGRNISVKGVNFNSAKYISHELHEELSKRCKPEYDDVLYTKGGTTGIACVNRNDFEFNVWVHVAVLRVTDESVVDPEYLKIALNSPTCYEQSQSYTHGVGNKDLGLTRMIKICFPTPAIEEQTEIIRRVEELFTFADQIEQQVKSAQGRVNNLIQSILAKAFRGELTAQWREENPDLITGDNSAEALLAKIQAERDKLAPKKRPKTTRKKVAKK